MATKKHAPLPTGDYAPITGARSEISFGVVRNPAPDGKPMTAIQAVFKRLYPVTKPLDPTAPWVRPSCERYDVLLPRGAPDHLMDVQTLCRSYDEASFGTIRDILSNVTVRFPESECLKSPLRLSEIWEIGRSYFLDLARTHQTPIVICLHVPGRAARVGPPHLHGLAMGRTCVPSSWSTFSRLAADEARNIIDESWIKHRKAVGLGK
jgi:hypothetical protein